METKIVNKIGECQNANTSVFFVFFLLALFITSGCSEISNSSSLTHVGLLLEDAIDDQGWNSKGYQGLLSIHSKMGIDVSYKEDVNTKGKTEAAIADLANQNVELIFGHGRSFADYFSAAAAEYPQIHFVSFNGHVTGDNVTSLQFDSYAMGYFAGMVSSQMSTSKKSRCHCRLSLAA